MNLKKNRWLIALSAVAIHLSIGSVYAYSVFKNPLAEMFGWNSKEVTLSFTIAIFFLGMSAATMGKFVEKWGPRKSATIAAIFFSIGTAGTGLAVELGSLPMYYLTYGVLGGIGLGIGYISPVSTLVKWFPDKRGLATGMAVMGFGAGAIITSPVATKLMETVGLSSTFYILGIAFLLLMLSGASYIVRPPEGYMPKNMGKTNIVKKKKDDLAQLTLGEAAKTVRFWLLWFMMFINISAGIMLISVASPIAQDKVGMTVAAAATVVAVMGFFNGLGRILWSSFSDYIGREHMFLVFFTVQMILFIIMPNISNPVVFQIFLYVIVSMYGGGFSCLPAFIGDLFGTKQLGAIHGCILTAWSCAGIFGPMIVASILDATSSYNMTFYVFAVLLFLALFASMVMKLNVKQIRAINKEKVSSIA
ncbi:OFA family MFS transporter [Fervidibacillus halotolerans]|uniref:OFA family MFS transporter n=1 Tax=Fervidibacillus halotolerans TaxID=2980027 RepID=A0A9E8LZQ4_9BACI|nr:OFA family MFS transporter [Fervidibacillus halotolerans]WAA11966.1 OFA family MFS transporter [Fervidibacillus halotolerans]